MINMNLLEIKTKYENEISRLNIKIKDLEKNYENIELISRFYSYNNSKP